MAPCLGCNDKKCRDCKRRRKEAANERGTPDWVLKWALEKVHADRFDLDVAASEELHCADTYMTKNMNSLGMSWYLDEPGNVWCNPPFDKIPEFVDKAWHEWAEGNCKSICMLIPANRTEQPFWASQIEQQRDSWGSSLTTHFIPGRVKFKGFKGSPPFGCVLLVWKVWK